MPTQPNLLAQQQNPFGLQDLEGTDEGLQAIFQQARPGFLQTGTQQNIFDQMFRRIMNNFLGEVGTNFRTGETPQSFTDFVQGQDFNRMFRRETAGDRGRGLTSAASFLFDR